ncbi:hypothetical protein swp_1313 [Shewanella piezotolerans WP3]|uniref:Uncharacterized protein n=1 Tax=Shewanella piezotolerans (strain WP3 / JCM 13877) TaxID=225849 RepID=B8CJK4_SHEPW|nr:hypothetical protein swp_1313 [Shewanella piezotolerans WP3]
MTVKQGDIDTMLKLESIVSHSGNPFGCSDEVA